VRNWRVITAIAAVVLAAIAGVLVWQYVDEADERAEEDNELVDIVVADGPIARGTTGAAAIANEQFGVEKFRRESVRDTFIRPADEEELRALRDLIAVTEIPSGTPIQREFFIERGQTEGFSGLVEEGKQAISITVDDSHGVAGLVKPNDWVNVLLTMTITDLRNPGGTGVDTTAFLIPGVEVLAVGTTTELGNQAQVTRSNDTNGDGRIDENDDADTVQTVQRGLLTLAVTPRQAQQIAHAVSQGTIYLSLNPDGFEPGDFTVPAEIVEAINLFDQPLTTVEDALRTIREAQPRG